MISGLSEAMIRQYATDESFRRGDEYYRNGAVRSLTRRDSLLQSEVEGNEPEPYGVRITLDEGGIVDAACACAYAWGGWCKHVVATLLVCLHQPERIETRPSIEAILAELDRAQIQTVLLRATERDPSLADVIEREAALARAVDTSVAPNPRPARPARQTTVDVRDVRRQVRAALHGLDSMRASEAYWHVGSIVGDVATVLERAWAFTRAGDARSALAILDAMTDEYVQGWTELDDSEGELGDFFSRLGEAWTEALLAADLSADERDSWAEMLEDWAAEVEQYGVDDAFDLPIAAAAQGWDDPALRALMRGETVAGAVGDREGIRLDLTDARLNVLERQGRDDEFLNLARATGRAQRYASQLTRLGRTSEAVSFGLEHLTTGTDALALARVLREQDKLEEAARIGERGLSLEGPKGDLAEWLRDLASALGKRDLALNAAEIAFRENPNLPSYLRVQDLAGADWPEHRARLLDRLRQVRTYSLAGPIEVLLHERQIDDAIAVVEGSYSHDLIEKVAVAAIETHPDWVIQTCRREAEAIMDAGKAQYYDRAAQWLTHAARAYRVAKRQGDFEGYLAELIGRHARKYKLVPLLKALRAA
ncbi:MAG: SWIM zinc finger family protein [Chloroflexota bacterium]